MIELSENQNKIVDFEGHLLVVAPPGSGKTFTLVKKIEQVQSKSSKLILALTFSNKAAEELNDRITNKKNVQASTIHSFCQDLVLTRGFQLGLNKGLRIITEESDKFHVIKTVINNSGYLKENLKELNDDYLRKISIFISNQKSKFVLPDTLKRVPSVNSEIYFEIYNGYR